MARSSSAKTDSGAGVTLASSDSARSSSADCSSSTATGVGSVGCTSIGPRDALRFLADVPLYHRRRSLWYTKRKVKTAMIKMGLRRKSTRLLAATCGSWRTVPITVGDSVATGGKGGTVEPFSTSPGSSSNTFDASPPGRVGKLCLKVRRPAPSKKWRPTKAFRSWVGSTSWWLSHQPSLVHWACGALTMRG